MNLIELEVGLALEQIQVVDFDFVFVVVAMLLLLQSTYPAFARDSKLRSWYCALADDWGQWGIN
jgi:hypothetical protein